MKSIIKKIAAFFGFNDVPKTAREEFELIFRHISSQKRLDECSKMAYRAVQKKETIQAGRVHPYEGTLRADCIKADAALSAYRNDELTEKFGDAQYLIAQINGGMDSQLSEVRAEAIEQQLAAVVAQNTPASENLKARLAEREQELKIFKGAHGISAHYEPPGKTNTLFYAATFAIIESAANFFFLKESFLPIIALFIAAALAGLNVGGNVWLGNRYREKNHTDLIRASRGKLNFAYAVALTFGVGGVIAGARYWSQSAVDGGFLIESIVLLAIGVALAIMSFTKGYSMDDPFPGLGPLTRATEELRAEFRLLAESHAAYCEKLRKTAKANHDSTKARIRSAATTLATTLPDLAKALQEWGHQREQIDEAYTQQQQVFKAIMTANSQDGTIYPQDIDHLPDSPQLITRQNEVTALTESRKNIKEEVDRLLLEVEKSLSEIQVWFNTENAKKLLRWPS